MYIDLFIDRYGLLIYINPCISIPLYIFTITCEQGMLPTIPVLQRLSR